MTKCDFHPQVRQQQRFSKKENARAIVGARLFMPKETGSSRPAPPKRNIDFLLEKLQAGHKTMTHCHGGNMAQAMFRIAGVLEGDRRGVRFLPKQVIRRALRKMRSSGSGTRSYVPPL